MNSTNHTKIDRNPIALCFTILTSRADYRSGVISRETEITINSVALPVSVKIAHHMNIQQDTPQTSYQNRLALS